jgi:1-deoxy-D-xylulose-5-phosphate reductoisomerase
VSNVSTSHVPDDPSVNDQSRTAAGNEVAERSSLPLRRVAVLGATGSIGTATVDVLCHLNRVDPLYRWKLWTASAHQNLDALEAVLRQATDGCDDGPADSLGVPERLIFSDPTTIDRDQAAERFRHFGVGTRAIQCGPDALVAAAEAPELDVLVAAIVGRAGLESTVAAVRAGKRVALANKETLVVAGGLVRQLAAESGGSLLPVDSEHSAIWQCIVGAGRNDGGEDSAGCADQSGHVKRLILTASGGAFRTASREEMERATPESALTHPTWQMGRKITIDSATMMNKALEIIEARWLFDVPAERIEVVIHPQSIIHSMVEFDDDSVLAQMSPPDMRLPIQYALTHPRRLPCPTESLDRERSWELTLTPADRERFPALDLGFEVARVGGTAGAVVNASNEIAVGLFLDGQIRFTDIVPLCRKILENHDFEQQPSLSRLLELDRWARVETETGAGRI